MRGQKWWPRSDLKEGPPAVLEGKGAFSREGRGQTLVPVATTAGESGRFNRDPSLFLLTDLSLCLYFMSHAPSGAVVLQPEPAPQSPPGGLVTAQIAGPRRPHSFCFGPAEHLLF